MQIDKYSGCMKCGTKVVSDDGDPEIGTCVKCTMMQCIYAGKEELSAQIMVKAKIFQKQNFSLWFTRDGIIQSAVKV